MGILNKLFGKRPGVKISGGNNLIPPYLTPTQKLIFLNMDSQDGVAVFNKLWVAYKCISMVGENVSTLPVDVVDSNGDKVEDKITQSFLHNPNPLDTNTDLLEQFTNFFLMSGDGYIWQVEGLDSDYWTLMSQNVKAIPGDSAKGEMPIKGYRDNSNDKSVFYPVESVIHLKSFNPESRINGMSRLQAGMSEISFAEQMGNYKNSLYANQAVIPGALSTDGSLTDEQFKRLIKQFNENHAGTSNAGRNLLLEAGLKYVPMAFSPTDLGIIKSESMTESKIASLIGAGLSDMLNLSEQRNYANYREARKAFYEETIIPIGKKINALLDKFFYPDGSRHFQIRMNEISALRMSAEELDKKWWITPNNRRTLDGFEPMDNPLMDKIYLPSALIDIDFMGGSDNSKL